MSNLSKSLRGLILALCAVLPGLALTGCGGGGGSLQNCCSSSSGGSQAASTVQVPTITNLNPAIDSQSIVTITGTHLTGATAVNFGTVPGTIVTVVSDTEMTVSYSENNPDDPALVTVTTPAGTSNALPFTFK